MTSSPPPDVEVRELADETDTRGVLRVAALAWQRAYADILSPDALAAVDPDPDSGRVRQAHEGLRGDDRVTLVADDGRVRGFVALCWGEAAKPFVGVREAGVKELYVEPDRWHQGIGTTLLERGLEELPADVRRVRLETLADNEDARRFYEARGFERTSTATFEVAGESYPSVVYSRPP